MAIYLVRHGDAGTRARWKGDDGLRPLNKRGRDQAHYLAKLLSDRPIGRIYSSPSLRCIESVQPLADQLGLEVLTRKELAENANPKDAVAFVVDRAKRDPIMCSHGDLIPKIIRRLVSDGMHIHEPNLSQKGSVWEIEVEGGTAVRALYHPPGTTRS